MLIVVQFQAARASLLAPRAGASQLSQYSQKRTISEYKELFQDQSSYPSYISSIRRHVANVLGVESSSPPSL